MGRIDLLKRLYRHVGNNIRMTTFDSIIWLINLVPSTFGFSIHHDKVTAPFWIIHCTLLFYVYGMGIAVYQIKFAHGAEDFIKSYVNVSLIILIGNISFWWLRKRPILRKAVKIMEKSDELARKNPIVQKSYNRRIIIIKLIVCAFYTSQIVDAALVYIPHRVDILADYSMVPCVGMGDLSKSPNREICISILLVQELSIMSVCLNYQTLLLTLIAHTATMYHILSLEILTFNDCKDLNELKKSAKELLPLYIKRHVLILDAFECLKGLYSMPIGIDFGSNAVCIALFFYLSLAEWLKFSPILIYCFLVFFLYCFLCQKLTNAAEEFEQAVYGCGWDSFDVRERKMVYVMLRQAQKPVILLAADIIPVNIYTFATTLQAMFKFVTVIKF